MSMLCLQTSREECDFDRELLLLWGYSSVEMVLHPAGWRGRIGGLD